MEQAESWTNPKTMLPPEMYSPCLGVAARYSTAIKRDASLVHSMIQAYASSSDLDSEKRHVMCCSSHKLSCIFTFHNCASDRCFSAFGTKIWMVGDWQYMLLAGCWLNQHLKVEDIFVILHV